MQVVLKTLNASCNTIQEIFPTIGQLQRLEELDLSENNLTVIQPSLSKCSAMIYLNLAENNIEVQNPSPSPSHEIGRFLLQSWASSFIQFAMTIPVLNILCPIIMRCAIPASTPSFLLQF